MVEPSVIHQICRDLYGSIHRNDFVKFSASYPLYKENREASHQCFRTEYRDGLLQMIVNKQFTEAIELVIRDADFDIYDECDCASEFLFACIPFHNDRFDVKWSPVTPCTLHHVIDTLIRQKYLDIKQLDDNGNGLLTRAILKQCWRAIDFLLAREEVDFLLESRLSEVELVCSAVVLYDERYDLTKTLVRKLLARFKMAKSINDSLYYALKMKKGLSLIDIFMQEGADVYGKDESGKSAMDVISADPELQGYYRDCFRQSVERNYTSCQAANSILDRDIHNLSVLNFPLDLFYLAERYADGNIDLMQLCLKTNVAKRVTLKNIDTTNEKGDTLLTYAIKNKFYRMIRYLLELGANVCRVNGKGETPLSTGVYHRNWTICEWLLEDGAEFTVNTALVTAIRSGCADGVEFLSKHNPDWNFINLRSYTPLMEAILSGNSDVVKFVLDSKPDFDITDTEKKTAMDISVERDLDQLTKLLITNGDNPNRLLRDTQELLLHKYLNDFNLDMIYFLIGNGADVNSLDRTGKCPLVKVLQLKNLNLMKSLLEHGADAFCEHFTRSTLLSFAAEMQSFPIVLFLLKNGADVTAARRELEEFADSNQDFNYHYVKLDLDSRVDHGTIS